MNQFICRTWTKGESDVQQETFDNQADALEYAKASRLHGYEAEVSEKQPDLFEAVS